MLKPIIETRRRGGKPAYDITNERFGRLIALHEVERGARGERRWLCQCDCGNTIIVYGYSLWNKRRHTRSCGCLQRDRASEANKTHGMSRKRLYKIWCAMKDRCYNAQNSHYYLYGARGIAVCDRWRDSFEHFLEDMGSSYRDNLTIERRDNNLGYSPENCCWATYYEQANHTSRNREITHNGRTQNMSQWAREVGIKPLIIWKRLDRGWTVEEALTSPPGRPRTKT